MKQPRGVLLILSLVMTSIVLAASLILGTIIIREVRLSTVSDKGIIAYYASESSAEQAMYSLLKLGQSTASLTGSGSYGNGSTWSRQANDTASQFVFDYLAKDKSVEVDIFNKTATKAAAGVDSIKISWSSGQTLETQLSEWDGTTLSAATTATYPCTGSPCTPVVLDAPSTTKAYRLVLVARGAAITDVFVNTFSANGASGTPVAVTSPRTVIAKGAYSGAQQAVQLSLPETPPWNGGSAVCGNGVTDAGETCDGNSQACTVSAQTGTQTCNSTCSGWNTCALNSVCGNSVVESGEQCDPPANVTGQCTVNANTCSASCLCVSKCGNGIVETGEQCDHGANNGANGDTCSATCQNVVVYSCTDLNLVRTLGNYGTSDGQVGSGANEAALDSAGNVYVADGSSLDIYNRIMVFTPTGQFLRKWSLPQVGGQVATAMGIAIDSNDNVYVSNNRYTIQKFTNTGTLLTSWGGYGFLDGQISYPGAGLAVDNQNNVYVGGSKIQKFDSTGTFLAKYAVNALYLTFDAANNLYANAFVAGLPTTVKLDASGNTVLTFSRASGYDKGIAVDPGGNNIFSAGSNGIAQYSNTGTLLKTYTTNRQNQGGLRMGANSHLFNVLYIYTLSGGVQELACVGASPICGNGLKEGTETCDDGNLTSSDGCSATCQAEFCVNPAFVRTFGADFFYNEDYDSSGNFYLNTGYQIKKYSSTGTYLSTVIDGSSIGFTSIRGLAIDRTNGFIYISDNYANKIGKFNMSGSLLTSWGTTGSGNGQFNALYGLVVDSSGNIWGADYYNSRIQKFNSSGTFLMAAGSNGGAPGQFIHPTYLGIDSANNVYAVDALQNVSKFSSVGTYISRFTLQYAAWPGQLGLGSNNEIWVGDQSGGLMVYSNGGNLLNRFASETGWGAMVGPNGHIYSIYIGATRAASGIREFACGNIGPVCGNGTLESGEQCDNGVSNSNTAACNTSCQLTYCGDNNTQSPNGQGATEQCDGGNYCGAACTCPACVTVNLAGMNEPIYQYWTGSTQYYNAYIAYPRCGSYVYSNLTPGSLSGVTSSCTDRGATCSNGWQQSNCAAYWQHQTSCPGCFGDASAYSSFYVTWDQYNNLAQCPASATTYFPTMTFTGGSFTACHP